MLAVAQVNEAGPVQPAGRVVRPLVMAIAVAGLPSSVVKVTVTGLAPPLTTAPIEPLGAVVAIRLLWVVEAYGIVTDPAFTAPELAR